MHRICVAGALLALGCLVLLPAKHAPTAPGRIPFEIPQYEVPADNAWDYYVAAFALLPDHSETWQRVDVAGWEPAVKDVEALMAEAAPALAKVREGLGKPCVPGAPNRDDLALSLFAPLNHARQVVHMLQWEGWLHARRGEYDAAFGSYLDGVRLGQDLARNGDLTPKLMSIACEAIACSAIRRSVAPARTDEAALSVLVERLAAVEAGDIPYAETMAVQYRYALDDVAFLRQECEKDPEAAAEFRAEYGSGPTAAYFILTRREVDRFYGEAVAAAKGDPRTWDEADLPRAKEGTAAEALCVGNRHTARKMAQHLATLRGTLLVAALELYRARTQEYPASLADLVPGILKALPPDPWSSEPFRYARITATEYKLYSVGADKEDDGGTGRYVNSYTHFSEEDMLFSPSAMLHAGGASDDGSG